MAERHRIDTLQLGRALAVLAVLLFHVEITFALPKYFGASIAPAARGGYAGVHYFFVLSGFVIWHAHGRDIGRPSGLRRFLYSRVTRLYPALWATLAILLAVHAVVPGLGPPGTTDPLTIASAFLVLPGGRDVILTPEWTLRQEVMFYLLFACVIALPRWGLAIAAGWLIVGAVLLPFPLPLPAAAWFSPFNLLFAFGVVAGWAFPRIQPGWGAPMAAAGLAAFALCWSLFPASDASSPWEHLAFGAAATAAILGGALVERRRPVTIPAPLLALGDASYSVYLVNFAAISALTKIATSLHATLPLPLPVWFGLVATGALVAGVAFHHAVEKPLLRLTRGRSRARSAAADQPREVAG